MWLTSGIAGFSFLLLGGYLLYNVLSVLSREKIECGWTIYLVIIISFLLGILFLYLNRKSSTTKGINEISCTLNANGGAIPFLIFYSRGFLFFFGIMLVLFSHWTILYINFPKENPVIRYTFEESKVINKLCGSKAKSKFLGSYQSGQLQYDIYCKNKQMSAAYYPSFHGYEISDGGNSIKFSADGEGYSGSTTTYSNHTIKWKVKDEGVLYFSNPL